MNPLWMIPAGIIFFILILLAWLNWPRKKKLVHTSTLRMYQVQVYQEDKMIYVGLHKGWYAEHACDQCRIHLELVGKLDHPPHNYKFFTHEK